MWRNVLGTLLVFSVFASFAGWVAPSAAHACSCRTAEAPVALEAAAAVFEAKVVKVVEPPMPEDGVRTLASLRRTVTVEVSRVWKGGVADTLTLETNSSSSLCGFPFEVGKSYLVYLDEPTVANDVVVGGSVSLCSRTKGIDKAGEDLKVLGEPTREVQRVESAKSAQASSNEANKFADADNKPTCASKGCGRCAAGPSHVSGATSAGAVALVALLLVSTWRRLRTRFHP